jgi:predicted RNA-binding protein YlxR (DUF448 family)
VSRRARLAADGRPRSRSPVRTCVGCRQREASSDLLRVVVDGTRTPPVLVPDPRRRQPGRGAHLHPVPDCLDLAERRRAFPRALRLPGPIDTGVLRDWVERWSPEPDVGTGTGPEPAGHRQTKGRRT